MGWGRVEVGLERGEREARNTKPGFVLTKATRKGRSTSSLLHIQAALLISQYPGCFGFLR